jgi:hypothetical protein
MDTENLEKNDVLTDFDVVNFLKELGYYGFPLSKQHYNGDESCLTVYNQHHKNGHVILAQQFSNFFAYRIQLQT